MEAPCKEEVIKNATLKAYVHKTKDGFSSEGLISINNLSEIREFKVFPENDYYASKENALNAVWEVMLAKLV